MKNADIFTTLTNKETWSIEEVLELLCGPANPSAIIRGETHQPMGELLETAANQGRFGMLATGVDKFHWNMELLQGGRYPDEPLDTITDFSAHHLRFLDWIKDEDVLDTIQLDADRKEDILDLIEKLNDERPEVKPVAHVIDYQRLLEEDFWTLTDLRIVLFGETYSSRYNPDLYHKYNSNLESLMQRVDRVVQDAALSRRHLEAHEIQNRSPLIGSARENEVEQSLENFGYFGIYDTDESGYRSQRYYHSPDLFNVLTLKGFPIPKGLSVSLDQNRIKPALELLKKLRENILYLEVHRKNPPNTQVDKIDQRPKIGFKGEIEKDEFVREGDFWIVSIRGEKASGLKHLKGMSYIHILFDNNDKSFHVVELDQMVAGKPQIPEDLQREYEYMGTDIENPKEINVDKFLTVQEQGIEVKKGVKGIESGITPKQIKNLLIYKESLEKELEGAIRSGDLEYEKKLQGDLNTMKKYLNMISFNGNIKTIKPETNRVRQRVQRCIADAITNIKKNNEHLGNHLKQHIKTGEFCRYIS
jgi:hypothetical protein